MYKVILNSSGNTKLCNMIFYFIVQDFSFDIYVNNCVCPVPFRSVMLSLTHETCVHRREKQPGGCFESRVLYSLETNPL